jgi:CheY-like chemotaxis protein
MSKILQTVIQNFEVTKTIFFYLALKPLWRLMQEKSVLIYDDEKEILKVSRLILQDEYTNVETCISAENLFEDIERVKPDIILMDLWMPMVSGEDAIDLLRNNEKTKHIPVVVFSAVNEIEKISKKINATALLKKPFSVVELKDTVEKYIL